MAEAWKELIARQLDVDRQRHANNPGVQALGQLLASVTADRKQIKTETRQEERDVRTDIRRADLASRGAAQQATYNRYPSVAAKDAGLEVPETAAIGMGTPPEGMSLKQVTVGEDGMPSYQYGQELSESTLAKIYTDYTTEVRKSNQQMMNTAQLLGSEPQLIDVPTYDDWKMENFGIGGKSDGGANASDDQLLAQFNFTEEDVVATMEEEGVSREQVFQYLRSQVGG